MNKQSALALAIDVAKEYARSGGNANTEWVLEQTYNKIVEIAERDGILY